MPFPALKIAFSSILPRVLLQIALRLAPLSSAFCCILRYVLLHFIDSFAHLSSRFCIVENTNPPKNFNK